ncbi:MAG: exodeoxyribonuclease VII small subunit [Deltaproteobacteria bacterium]|nr:exodeoxyribonuclease VII small subunit [Deltaproteobacteria bacterium]MBW1928520.1 exodeoxyribonuclease VII small subunit [Deltaproteobacteria bacterium]MBW2024252.1 exodeoxyribonuclease VII small subunit [Deltaproteobacteria bacterium]MBW2124608.1 exodeoxyribonuclease VII small subunit [Deltaproteobacteria bacterium]RLB24529.1 MAG: exodeoxyribonuclease VII small subunit [Deltaproteobacteria bacterium]
MPAKKFENAMQRLEQIVQSLESGELSLEDSIKAFEEGMRLAKFCSEKLEEAEKKVTMLIKESDGKYVQTPFQVNQEEAED